MKVLLTRRAYLAGAAMAILGGIGVTRIIRSHLFRPDRAEAASITVNDVTFNPLVVRRPDGSTITGLISERTPRSDFSRGIVVFLHGNGGHAGVNAQHLTQLVTSGFETVIAEYTGYGANPGSPSQAALLHDATLFLGHATSIAAGRPVLLVGHSLGGAIAILVAADRKLAGLLTINAVSQVRPFVPLLAQPFLLDPFDALAVAPQVRAPWLIVHGEADNQVPPEHADALYAAADKTAATLVKLPGRDHGFDAALIAELTARLCRMAAID